MIANQNGGEKIGNKNYSFLIVGLFLILFSSIVFYYAAETEQIRTIQVDCFDGYKNQMTGYNCEEKQSTYYGLEKDSPVILLIFMVTSLFLLIGGTLIILFTYSIIDSRPTNKLFTWRC